MVENSHASTSLSYADGLAKAFTLRGEDRHVVAVIGDGALTGGMAWEALNNIAVGKDRKLVMVVNDNGRSYMPTVGGLATHLASLRTNPRYEEVLDAVKSRLNKVPGVGPAVYDALHAMKKGMKDALAPQGMFEDLGLKYVGPIDGHDRQAVEQALGQAKRFGGPVIVHVMTRKGFGYDPAERNEADQFHQIGAFDVETGEARPRRTDLDRLLRRGDGRARRRAIRTSSGSPRRCSTRSGSTASRRRTRSGSSTSASPSSTPSPAPPDSRWAGMHPVVAIYATFLNRAFDQVLMDVALHRCGVTFVLDRAGVTGTDGASHNGMWDLSILQVVPGLRIAAPRDGARVRELLREAVAVDDAPTVVRLPKGSPPADLEAVDRIGGCDVLLRRSGKDVLVVGIGSMASVASRSASASPRRASASPSSTPAGSSRSTPRSSAWPRDHRLVVSIEDNGRVGGVGSALLQLLSDQGVVHAVLAARHPAGVPAPRRAAGDPRPDRPQRPDHRPRHRRAAGRRRPRAGLAEHRPAPALTPDARRCHPGGSP